MNVLDQKPNSLEEHWMPFSGNRAFKEDPRLLVKAEGVYYWNHKGEKLIDGSSGLFCCALGHGRKEIADAVAKQLTTLDYASPFQMGHAGSFEVARRVADLTPDDLNHVFFVNSGSEAIDTALKISIAYHRARGDGQRRHFVSRERAYHGVNIGGTTLGGIMKNREAFGSVMPGVVHMRHTWLEENKFTQGQPKTGAELAEDLDRFASLLGGDSIAACFVEPIAGSTGCLVPPVGYLERLREICDAHGILLVFDEVICGFGRTGTPFAAETFSVTPDIITMAKGITNGAQPMGAVAVRDGIYETVMESAAPGAIELFHGYTYSGHPAACAASLAVLDIYEKEGVFTNAATMAPYFQDAIFGMKDISGISDIRGYGMLAGIDLSPEGGAGARGMKIHKKLFSSGVYIKFTGDTALVAPPLVSTKENIDEIISGIKRVLEDG
ncbi:MAG: aspartate aminotransferase family protein [Rhodospirillaceae bacterium]|jgi:beta-alanine--pyruvate transaminase|nr:aspartate aminotransferase family protein [Rhodospirillaceae bacterium]MBT7485793.1 aspartate aminotransferase family protein [Rhodospirillales bacterium]MBT4701503.1 aspartate aminotransferase family protein [Rhodospirillaceae bacterium]MBT5035279.1 aspartate aminotransferase family protein [Rhodospirillaceae bacterium]MBT6222026.1 aspartate aminotransferase family protein [Rhodospirillaceae bacterium]